MLNKKQFDEFGNDLGEMAQEHVADVEREEHELRAAQQEPFDLLGVEPEPEVIRHKGITVYKYKNKP